MFSPRTRKHWLRFVAIRLAAYLTIAYLTAGAFFFFEQNKILFPAPRNFAKQNPAFPFEEIRIEVNSSDYLHAWWIPSATAPEKVILVFHGNGYVLEEMAGDEAGVLHAIGVNLLLVDYRGYGSSAPVSPNEQTINEDAQASLDYLIKRRHIPINNVFVLGRSIGSGPAGYLALKNKELRGLILESPFSSIEDAADGSWYFHIYPLRLLLRTHFDTLSKISSVRTPLLIVSGTKDTLTPPWMAERIFALANQPKQLYLVPAGHDDLLIIGGNTLTQRLQKFVQEGR